MKILITTMFAGLLMIGTIISTTPSQATAGVDKYTCEFSVDEEVIVAEVSVKIKGNGDTVVNVDYFTDGYAEYLGKYEERNGEVVPSNTSEACEFAENHFGDRQ